VDATVSDRLAVAQPHQRSPWAEGFVGTVRYARRNPTLIVGFVLLLGLLLFVVIGSFVVDTDKARALSVRPLQEPSDRYPLGTDKQGRDMLALMVAGIPLTLRIGLIAGILGVGFGAIVAFVAAYYGGWIDAVTRVVVDTALTIPGLMLLIVIAMSLKTSLSVDQMALVIASLAWLSPARVIRSQVLSIRERSYVQLARLSGVGGPEIIFKELLPNLLPYLVASLVTAVSAAILASIGLEVLGLGSLDSPTLGMTLYWVNYSAALINGWWWWWVPPIVVIAVLFLGLFLVTIGLDEFANPRLRRQV
jgi:peptide/nickel transport system permease protein